MRCWITICEAGETEAPVLAKFKVGDWVYSDIARDVGRVRQHEQDDDATMNFYTVQWDDGTLTRDVPETTLKRAATPSAQKTPPHLLPAPKSPAVKLPLVANVIKGRAAVTIQPSAPITEAAQRMVHYNIGALPVTDGDDLVGIVSERDIVRKVVAHGDDLRSMTVADVMTRHPMTIGSEDTLTTAVKLMTKGHFRHLPITSDGRITGMLSSKDVISTLLAGR